VGGASGAALVEVYDLSPENLSTVSVRASVATTDTIGRSPAILTFSRTGVVKEAITVEYTVAGTATAGVDYEPLTGRVTIPAGATSATVTLSPKANPANINNRTALVSITPKPAYGVGVDDQAALTIFANTGSLYVSNLRTLPGAAASTAYGTATIQLAPDEKSAFVNVSFSNLSSPQVVAHLEINGNYVMNLPQGQVSNAVWTFAPVGTYATTDLVAALKAGRVAVSIDTASFPGGELGGGFVRSTGPFEGFPKGSGSFPDPGHLRRDAGGDHQGRRQGLLRMDHRADQRRPAFLAPRGDDARLQPQPDQRRHRQPQRRHPRL
jgi:hypothetical protein